MQTNNQNLPPVPKPPADYENNSPPAPPVSQPPDSSAQLPSVSPVSENAGQINYTDPQVINMRNKKIIKIFVLALVILGIIGILYFTLNHKGSSDVEVSGNQVKFKFQDNGITGQLAPKEIVAFVTNGGQTESSDSGLFGVIPSTKVRYLEQKYTDIIHCGSAGVEEVKSNEFSAYFIANSSNTKSSLQNLDRLMKKGNWVEFEIEGQPISQMQANQNGRNVTIMSQSNLVFYLVDNLRIIRENYQ